MGCFDSVCSISHLPITEDDDIVLIYVGSMSHNVYGRTVYRPIMFPIFGKYNDYGDIKDVDPDSFGLKMAQQLVTTMFTGVTLPTHHQQEPWEIFRDNTRRGSVQLLPDRWTIGSNKSKFVLDDTCQHDTHTYTMHCGNGSNVARLLIHKNVYTHICRSFQKTPIGYGKKRKSIVEYMVDIPEYILESTRRLKLMDSVLSGKNHQELVEQTGLTYTDIMTGGNIFKDDHNHALDCMMDNTGDDISFYFMALITYKRMFENFCKNDQVNKATELITAMCDVYTFMGGLHIFNMGCEPYQGHAAEQYQGILGANKMIGLFDVFIDIEKTKIKNWEAVE